MFSQQYFTPNGCPYQTSVAARNALKRIKTRQNKQACFKIRFTETGCLDEGDALKSLYKGDHAIYHPNGTNEIVLDDDWFISAMIKRYVKIDEQYDGEFTAEIKMRYFEYKDDNGYIQYAPDIGRVSISMTHK